MQDSNNKVTVVVHIDDAPAFYSAYAEAVVEALKRLTQPNKQHTKKYPLGTKKYQEGISIFAGLKK